MECYSCHEMANFHFVINGRIDFPPEINAKVISMCCRNYLRTDVDGSAMDFPLSALTQSPTETLEQFMAMRAKAIAKGKWGGRRRS